MALQVSAPENSRNSDFLLRWHLQAPDGGQWQRSHNDVLDNGNDARCHNAIAFVDAFVLVPRQDPLVVDLVPKRIKGPASY